MHGTTLKIHLNSLRRLQSLRRIAFGIQNFFSDFSKVTCILACFMTKQASQRHTLTSSLSNPLNQHTVKILILCPTHCLPVLHCVLFDTVTAKLQQLVFLFL